AGERGAEVRTAVFDKPLVREARVITRCAVTSDVARGGSFDSGRRSRPSPVIGDGRNIDVLRPLSVEEGREGKLPGGFARPGCCPDRERNGGHCQKVQTLCEHSIHVSLLRKWWFGKSRQRRANVRRRFHRARAA